MSKPFIIQASSRTAMAKAYGISVYLFKEWIAAEPILKKKLDKFKRTFPPHITEAIVNTFGTPE